MKKNANAKLILAVLVLSMLMMLLLPACQNSETPDKTEPETTAAPETTEAAKPSEPAKEKLVIYWNLDRQKYADQERQKGSDGYYTVNFAAGGKLSAMKVKDDAALVKKIDTMDVMCLVLDDNKVVTDAVPVTEKGCTIIAEGYYVESYSNAKLTVNPKEDFSGTSETLSITFSTFVTDVTSERVQVLYNLMESDRVVAVADESGALTDVFMYAGGELRVGRTAYCEHCKQEVHWEAWTTVTSLPISSSGHYYLYNDVIADRQQSLDSGVELILDLNGKMITRAGGKEIEGTGRVISIHNEGSYLAVMDSSEEKTGTIKMVGEVYAQGGGVWMRLGNFDLYSGTIDGTGIVNSSLGAVVSVSTGFTFNMYGGTILGATTKSGFEEGKNSSGGCGGSVYVYGEFNMYGGTIQGGIALTSEYDGETPKGKGGNVYVSKTGVFNMSGGEIKGGTAETEGNNLYVAEGGVFNQTGGTIEGME